MRVRHRGNALPETAMVMSLTLLLLFGAVQMALADFYQVSADGASFMAAQKTVALKGASANQSTAQAIASAMFTHILSSDVSSASSSSGAAAFETDVVKSVATIGGVPGFSNSLAIQSRTVEPGVASTTGRAPVNFCAQSLGSSPVSFLSNTVNAVPSGLTPLVNDATGAVNASAVSNHSSKLYQSTTGATGLYQSLTSLLTPSTGHIALLSSVTSPLLNLPVVGPVIQSVLTHVQSVEVDALKGDATTSELTGLVSTVQTLLSPILGTLTLLGLGSAASSIVTDVTNVVTDLTNINTDQQYVNSLAGLC